MSIGTVVTEGYGSFGTIGAVVLQGYFDSGGTPAPAVEVSVGGGGSRKRRKNVPEYIRFEEKEKAPDLSEFEVPKKVAKAARKVLEKAPADDSAAVRMLRNELSRLHIPFKPQYAQIVVKPVFDPEAHRRKLDEEDVEMILLFG